LFLALSYATVAAMLGVLVSMAFTPQLQREFYASLACVVVVVIAYALRCSRV
jgi:L-asparagine transporter-like permease